MLTECDAAWKRERTEWPLGISDDAKMHHYAEIGKNVDPHLPTLLALSRWSIEAKAALIYSKNSLEWAIAVMKQNGITESQLADYKESRNQNDAALNSFPLPHAQ